MTLYKMAGEIVLRAIESSDLSEDFIFVDKRTGKTFKFNTCTKMFTDADLCEPIWGTFDAVMLNNLNFLKILTFHKKSKINTTYEPKIMGILIDDITIKFYLDDPNLDDAGVWLNVDAAANGSLVLSKRNPTQNITSQFVPGANTDLPNPENATQRRVCEIIAGSKVVYSDHIFL